MIYKLVEQLNHENFREVVSEYNTLANLEVKKQKEKRLTSAVSSRLFLIAINNVMEKQSQEQVTHVEKTAEIAASFANELNLSKQDKLSLVLIAKYHDIGKINISKDILNKPGKLNDEEWQKIKEHPTYSYNILSVFPSFEKVANGALAHHERFDGTGYPNRTVGKNIPYLARIISILDTFEVLTSGRVYKAPVSVNDALTELKRCSGTQFDPELVNQFTNFITKTHTQDDFQK